MRAVILWKTKYETLNAKPIPSLLSLFPSLHPSYYKIATAQKRHKALYVYAMSLLNVK